MTDTDRTDAAAPGKPARPHRVVINRAPEPSEVQRRLEKERKLLTTGIVDPGEFAIELAAEFDRRARGGRNSTVGTVTLFEIPGLRHRFGDPAVFDVVSEVTDVIHGLFTEVDIITVAEDGEILVMSRETRVGSAMARLEKVCKAIAGQSFEVNGERVLLTPSAGVATLDDGSDPADVVRRAVDAREVAAGHLDLRVHRWEAAMSADTAPEEKEPFNRFGWQETKERLRAPSQILATYVLGLFFPFCFYWTMANVVGFDVTWWVYISVVLTLVLTGLMILVEANLAVKQDEPPFVADEDFPEATAIICAYLPNEAATIVGTIDAFLNQGYPGGIQVIVAYNTPNSMPIERELAQMAVDHPNLDVVRVEGSTSKAQNVNAVLGMARGEFTGMFDADHEPRPGSFERAWRWLANGYSVVQGHCLTRNGEETRLARMVAVEFESIYAVAHPGRAKLHRFGVFGGSNGYWKTDLLHETRMRGSMLTEDIDSSMRTVERGLKIRSDRDVVSRELGTTTFKQVWNQRLRWAQGWFQVTMMHTFRVWRSPGLTLRQKLGASYLLGYREIYPWLSLQIIPLVAFWLTRGDSLSFGFPVFFCTTLFVLHIGPVQTWYAYRLADPEIKQHKSWFVAYLLFSTLFYTEYKNIIARVAHVKEFVGERAWKVTPRGDDPIEFEDDDESSDELDTNVADGTGSVAVPVPSVAESSDAVTTPAGLPARRTSSPTADVAGLPMRRTGGDAGVEGGAARRESDQGGDGHPLRRADDRRGGVERRGLGPTPQVIDVEGLPMRRRSTDVGGPADRRSPEVTNGEPPSRRSDDRRGGVDRRGNGPTPVVVGVDGLPMRRRSTDTDVGAERRSSEPTGAPLPVRARSSDVRNSSHTEAADTAESSRLTRRASGLVPTSGVTAEPLLPPSPATAPRTRPVTLDETLISDRVRRLAERSTVEFDGDEPSPDDEHDSTVG